MKTLSNTLIIFSVLKLIRSSVLKDGRKLVLLRRSRSAAMWGRGDGGKLSAAEGDRCSNIIPEI